MPDNLRYQSFQKAPFRSRSDAGYRSALRLAKAIACALFLSPRWSSASFAEVSPHVATASLRCLDRVIWNVRCSLDGGVGAPGPNARGCTPFRKGTANSCVGRAITQCVRSVYPRLRPLWTTSTPFVRGIGDVILGSQPRNQASWKFLCNVFLGLWMFLYQSHLVRHCLFS